MAHNPAPIISQGFSQYWERFFWFCGGLGSEVSIDELVFGSEALQVESKINDRELINLFSKVQILNEKQKDTVKDLISAFILKADLQQKLI